MSLPNKPEANCRFSRKSRLLERKEFLKFFQGSQKYSRDAVLFYSHNNQLGYPRLGVTIKRKCSSVERNRIKRAVREAFRENQGNLGSKDFNIVISTRVPLERTEVRKYRAGLSLGLLRG